MEVEYKRVKISDLHKDPANARLHNSENLSDIRASLKHFGQVEPLVVQKATGKVIGGNGRLDVMVELGWEECDVAYVDFDNMQATALGIALNRAGERSEWNPDVLDKLLSEIDGVSEELAASLKELEKEVGIDEEPAGDADAEPQIDKAAELQKKWGTATGQLWLIGEHRLLCGDSTKREDVERVMDGDKAKFEFSDCPYQIDTQGGGVMKESGHLQKITDAGIDKFTPSTLTKEAPTSVFCCNKPLIPDYITLAKEWSCAWDICFWKKNNTPPNYGGHLMTDVEYLMLIGEQSPVSGQEKDLYSKAFISDIVADREVGWQKPVQLVSKFIRLFSFVGSIVFDRFLGTGTTVVAAQNLNRKCYGIEISPAYCAVILERMKTAFPTLEIRLAE